MTDRELLELAAKAAGYPIDEGSYEECAKTGCGWWIYIDGSGEPPNDSAWTEIWNPLTDDGDALRLAVKLEMLADFCGDTTCAYGEMWHREKKCDDPYAATRRAIVRAAAEIGKAMK